jgi:hypothetical protein
MSELLQFIIVIAFGALCFGVGYLTAFIVTRNKYRDEMIKRGVARYNWQTGKWEWGESRQSRNIEMPERRDRVIRLMSAFGGKVDVDQKSQDVCF